jgi:translation initiation factor IF-3
VRLVGSDGSQIGIVPTQDALRQAQELDLDLVEVAPQANPPVARIMDYGKFKYERDIRQKEARKKQARIEVKEIKFRPKIDPHDYATKKGHVERFLRAGARVKVTIRFRGREMARTELGRKILDRLVEDLADSAVVESSPKQDGRNMLMVLGPLKKKTEARAEIKAERDRRAAERLADAEAERSEQADRRAKAAAQPATKKRRGPADNLDPDMDLS